MREYRKRFVQMTMLLVGAVLLIMMGVIAVYLYRDYSDGLRATMQQVVEPLDAFAEPMERASQADPAPAAPAKSDQPEPQNVPAEQSPAAGEEPAADGNPADHDDGRQQGIITVFYVAESGETAVLSQESLFDTQTLAQILEVVSAQGTGYGTLADYHVIYYCSGNGNPYKIALVSTSYLTMRMVRLILMLVLIWIVAMGVLLLVSIRLSRVAVRPMEEAMRRERQFVADASHDLKTPLSVILANNSILRENPDATISSLTRWIDSTRAAADNMQQMIGDMLTLADVEREEAPLAIAEVDAAEIVMKAVLQLESVAYEKGVALDSELPDAVPVQTNADYLQRIAASLVENAIKYEPQGGTVTVRLTRARRGIMLTVHNDTAVIAAEDLPHIFERFYRGDKSRGSGAGGHGLGLSITRQMVERLGGHIEAASDAGQGTTFTVRIS